MPVVWGTRVYQMSDSINQLILNFLDRMIDENTKNAEAMIALKTAVSEQRIDLDKVLAEFSNGFKSEIKDKILDEASKEREILREIKAMISAVEGKQETEKQREERFRYYKKLNSFIQKFESPKTWIKLGISFIVALSLLTGGVATLVYRIPYIMGTNSNNPEIIDTENVAP